MRGRARDGVGAAVNEGEREKRDDREPTQRVEGMMARRRDGAMLAKSVETRERRPTVPARAGRGENRDGKYGRWEGGGREGSTACGEGGEWAAACPGSIL